MLGFVGAPFTLATYIVEGGSSKSFAAIKKMAFAEPAVLHALLEKLADNVADYVRYQVRAVCCLFVFVYLCVFVFLCWVEGHSHTAQSALELRARREPWGVTGLTCEPLLHKHTHTGRQWRAGGADL